MRFDSFFTIIGWNVDWCPLISFLKRQFKRPGDCHTFVSFNYDLVLERGIQRALNGRIDPTQLCTTASLVQFPTRRTASARVLRTYP